MRFFQTFLRGIFALSLVVQCLELSSAKAERSFVIKFKDRVTHEQALRGTGLGVTHKAEKVSLVEAVRSEGAQNKDDSNDEPCEKLLQDGLVEYCEDNFEIQLQAVPSDPYLIAQWVFSGSSTLDIGARKAWDISTGSKDTVVAVIDTGVDYSHPDLAANIWTNPGEIAGNGIDDDQNGFIDDLHGVNTAAANGDPLDDNGHGTHVAGIIGAVGNNGIGVSGVNWQVSIVAVKFLSGGGAGRLYDLLKGLSYLADLKRRGFNIAAVNMSWVTATYSQALYDGLAEVGNEGILLVAAAGNISADNDATPLYPASFDLPQLLSVAALDNNGALASFSNYGAQSVHIAAPGVGIFSTFPGASYVNLSGTSMATPFVAGAAALIHALRPESSALDLRRDILLGAAQSTKLSGFVNDARSLDLFGMLRREGGSTIVTPKDTITIDDGHLRFLREGKEALVSGRKSFVMVAADNAVSGGLRVSVAGTQCAQRSITVDSVFSIISLRTPKSRLRGPVQIELLNSAGEISDILQISLRQTRRDRLKLRSQKNRLRNVASVSEHMRRNWCSRLRQRML